MFAISLHPVGLVSFRQVFDQAFFAAVTLLGPAELMSMGWFFGGKPVPPRHSFLFWAARHSSEEHLCHWRLCCWHAIDPIYQSRLDGGIY